MNRTTEFSVLVTGVGGQGVLWLSRVIAMAACEVYPFVCRTETRGLSQRGGTVCSAVRFGANTVVPVVGSGTDDLLLSLDALEAARALQYLKPNATVLTNKQFVSPSHLLAHWHREGCEETSHATLDGMLKTLWDTRSNRHCVDLAELAGRSQNASLNVIMAGAASRLLPIPYAAMTAAVLATVRPHQKEIATAAFEAGRSAMASFAQFQDEISFKAA